MVVEVSNKQITPIEISRPFYSIFLHVQTEQQCNEAIEKFKELIKDSPLEDQDDIDYIKAEALAGLPKSFDKDTFSSYLDEIFEIEKKRRADSKTGVVLEFTDVELKNDGYLNNFADKIYSGLTTESKKILDEYCWKIANDDYQQFIQKFKEVNKPFIILPTQGKDRSEDIAKHSRDIKGDIPFYVLRNPSSSEYKKGKTAGSHWEFNQNIGTSTKKWYSRGDGSCGCYTIVGIIATESTFQTTEAQKMLKDSGIELANVKEGDRFGAENSGLNSKNSREFVALAIEKRIAESGTDLEKAELTNRLKEIRNEDYWLTDRDISDAFRGLGIEVFEAASLLKSEQEFETEKQRDQRRNVIKNLIGASGYHTKDENGKQVPATSQEIKLQQRLNKEQAQKDFIKVIGQDRANKFFADLNSSQEKIVSNPTAKPSSPAPIRPPSNSCQPKSATRQEELEAARKAAKDAINSFISQKSGLQSEQPIRLYIDTQKPTGKAERPYPGLGIRTKPKTIDAGNGIKVKALEIISIFESDDERFINSKGQKISGQDLIKDGNLFITAVKIPGESFATPIKDILDRPDWVKIFRSKGKIEFETYNPKTKQKDSYQCERQENHLFITDGCNEAKSSLKEGGVVGAKYNPDKHGVPQDLVREFTKQKALCRTA